MFVTDRYIVVHAGNRKGFVDGASLIFKSKKNSSDYHSEMNAETFEKWMKNDLLPSLSEPSIVVLDNASYHSRLEEKLPTCSWRKNELQTWLKKRNISFLEEYKKNTATLQVKL
jgi:hypothetical protein